MLNRQRTVNSIIEFSGIGLHTGEMTNLKIKPAKENIGIVFIRIDKKKNIK